MTEKPHAPHPVLWKRLFVFLGLYFQLLFLAACGSTSSTPATDTASREYLQLLGKFPEDNQGEGSDPFYTSRLTQEPMTYALVLSAESLHYQSFPSAAGARRIRNATQWLVENSDTDADEKHGWGLQDAWDAFGDGSTNPFNHPYTITTAVVLNGLLDAYNVPGLWSETEKGRLRNLITGVSRRWCNEIWTNTVNGGFFWYSPSVNDAHFVVNASSMMMGVIARTTKELGSHLSDDDLFLMRDRVEKGFLEVADRASLRCGLPFWNYTALPNVFNQDEPNDLVHHVYILWGIKLAESSGFAVNVPWSANKEKESLDVFWADGILRDYPQDVIYSNPLYNRPAILWGAGALLAYYAAAGNDAKVIAVRTLMDSNYGFPDLTLWPAFYSNDSSFYARYAAHVLWGLAHADFTSVGR